MAHKFWFKTLISACLLGATLSASAVPARPGITTITQSDGSTLAVRIMGDEDFHYCLSADGYLLMDVGGIKHYAVPGVDGRPVASDVKAVPAEKRSAAVKHMLATLDTDAMVSALHDISQSGAKDGMRRGPGLFFNASFPTLGTQRTIVVLVEYQDVKFRLSDPHDYFSRMLNQRDFGDYGGTGSARDYYLDASGSRFDPHFDVYGPVTLPHDMAWYGANTGGTTAPTPA